MFLKSGLGQQWLAGGRGDLQVELPVLLVFSFPDTLAFCSGGSGSSHLCLELGVGKFVLSILQLWKIFFLGSGLLNFHLALVSVSGVY